MSRTPRQRDLRNLVQGLTLIELMVALAVFAALGTLTYRGANALLTSHRIISSELEQWRELVRGLQIIETELLQIALPPAHDPHSGRPALEYRANPPELGFLALSANSRPEHVRFRLEHDTLHWERRSVSTPADTELDTLLTGVQTLRWVFFHDNHWHQQWPIPGASLTTLPAGIGLEIELADIGRINRIYALR